MLVSLSLSCGFSLSLFQTKKALYCCSWCLADLLSLNGAFGLGVVLAFAVKLRIAERWADLTEATGQRTLDEMIQTITKAPVHAALGDEQAQVLYWVDILSNALYVYDPATGHNRSYDVGQHVGTVVLRESGGVMLSLANGFASYDLASGKLNIMLGEKGLADKVVNLL